MKRITSAILVVMMAVGLMMLPALARAQGDPIDAFKEFGQHYMAKDWDAVWGMMEDSTKQSFSHLLLFGLALGAMADADIQERVEAEFGPLLEDDKAQFTKEHFATLMGMLEEVEMGEDDPQDVFTSIEIREVRREGDKAILMAGKDGDENEVIMMLQDGSWKLFIPDPFAELAKEMEGEEGEEGEKGEEAVKAEGDDGGTLTTPQKAMRKYFQKYQQGN